MEFLLCSCATHVPRATSMTDAAIAETLSSKSKLPLRVSELRHVYCWVCSAEEVRSLDNGEAMDPRSRFVHPCKCSLVAHEKVRGHCADHH